MRNPHLITVSLILGWACMAQAQFSNNPVKWPTPTGGMVCNAYPLGFNYMAPIVAANTSVSENSQTWNLVDMNGDGKPDLVVTGQAEGVNATPAEFGVGTSPHWKVYLNTGASFSSTAIIWPTPVGGSTYSTAQGFYDITGISTGTDSSQLWNLTDMDGDGKPDLVVTGTWSNGQAVQYNVGSNPYWLVYLNTGTGFSATAVMWPTPKGGFIVNGSMHLGYNVPTNTGTNNPSGGGASDSSQYWTLVDMNDDGKPDLVITALVDTAIATQFDAGAAPYWIVYLNTGTGFSATPANWHTPVGGTVYNGALLGYNQATGQLINDYLFAGSQLWSLTDINGDGKPDLVVTAVQTDVHGSAAQFNSTSSPYWLVYLNTGIGFAPDSLVWRTPLADSALLGDTLGLFYTGQVPGVQYSINSQWTVNIQQWSLVDMNGDGKPDLVITGKEINEQGIIGEIPFEFAAGTSPFWEVSLNTGSGFDTLRPPWTTPIGGDTLGIQPAGYNYIGTVAGLTLSIPTGGQSWSLTDLDGDGFPELVVQSNSGTGGNVEFSDSTGPYWQVYKNAAVAAIPATGATVPCLIYPNPSNGLFVLKLPDNQISCTMEVYNIVGEKVYQTLLSNQQNLVDLGAQADGVYLLHLKSGDGIQVIKALVTH